MDTETAVIDKSGRLLVPARQRRALGIKPGDSVRLQVVDGELRVTGWKKAVERIQALMAPYRPKPGEELISDQLIRERREEAARE